MASELLKKWLTDDGLEKIRVWAEKGLSVKQIASNMQVSETCLYTWQRNHEQIRSALRAGRKTANEIVENALFRIATGYDWTEVTTQDSDKGYMQKTVNRHVSPNEKAIEYWLKTKNPSVWGKRERLELQKLKAEIERLKAGLNPETEENKSNLLEALQGISEQVEELEKDMNGGQPV